MRGAMQSYRDLAEAGQISPSRMSQIRALTELAPSIQEELLFLPKIVSGREGIRESGLRKIARMMDWEAQTAAFRTQKDRFQPCCRVQIPPEQRLPAARDARHTP